MRQEYSNYLLYAPVALFALYAWGLTIYSFYMDARFKARKKAKKLRKKLALEKSVTESLANS